MVNPTQSYSTVNPSFDTSSIAEMLNNLGFPYGAAVENQTSVSFSITGFLGLLSITGAGDHDFEMTVIDNEDNVITKTLMIKTVK